MSQLLNMPFSKLVGNTKLMKKKPAVKKTKLKIALSLDIGSCNTKMLIGRQKTNTLYIEQTLMTRTPEKAYEDGTVTDPVSLEAMLKSLIARDKTNTKDLVFSIESSKIIKREFVIPRIPDEDILGLVTYEMGQYLPIDISEYIIQPNVIGSVMEDEMEKIKVSVSAVPKNIVKGYQNLFISAGLRPISMDVNSASVEKILKFDIMNNSESEFAGKNVVFIDMGHSCFNVSIYENGKYQFNRNIEIGGRMLDIMIAELLRTDWEKAKNIKEELCGKINAAELDTKFGGVPSNCQPDNAHEKILVELASTLNHWAGQVDKVLQYQTRTRVKSIDKMYLYGGSSLINGITEFFEKKLAVKTVMANIYNRFECAPGTDAQNIFTSYGNALGAIIRI